MKLKCIIIDDEPLAINVIKNHLSQIPETEVVGTFNNAIDSMEYLRNNEVHLLFLDINMPILDGLDFLRNLESHPMVIITTAYDAYAIQGYELAVLDYLLKPIPFPRFLKAVNKALDSRKVPPASKTEGRQSIFIKIDNKKLKKIYLDEILVVESLKDYIKIITSAEKYIIHQTLSNFTENLPKDKFLRIHRSYTVSLDKIEVLEGNSLSIKRVRYTIGRSYLNEVKEIILQRSI